MSFPYIFNIPNLETHLKYFYNISHNPKKFFTSTFILLRFSKDFYYLEMYNECHDI